MSRLSTFSEESDLNLSMRDLLAEMGANGLEVSLGAPRNLISRSLSLLSNSAIVLLGDSEMLSKDDDENKT